jgi:catechol 2,3-dioxygenase-like lactoylglutathione lyase family enzyme
MKLLSAGIFAASIAMAQLSAPNSSGVAMGHLHYTVQNVEANKKFWVALGGVAGKVGSTEAVRFPDVIILLSPGTASEGTDGSVVNHVAFRVRSLEAVAAAGFKVGGTNKNLPGLASVYTPEGERIELFDNTATNVLFTFDGPHDPVADRHNHPITVPVIMHHVHLYVPMGEVPKAKAWYLRTFGGVPGQRWHYEAVDLPGINFNFAESPKPTTPTKGRRLDHIGLEVRNLAAFRKKLEAGGIHFDESYTLRDSGVAAAFLSDPWGTRIELTEGLREALH